MNGIMGIMSVAVAMPLMALADSSSVVWVDWQSKASNPDGSETAPYKTLQAGVDAASAGATVMVRPGVYDTPYWYENGDASVSNCVCIGKENLRLESTDGAEVTHIVGRHASSTSGIGNDAVRCITITTNGVVVKGFTLRDGASRDTTYPANYAGGVYGYSTGTHSLVVDCVVSNCIASRAGAICNVDAIRSQFYNNYTVDGRHGSCGRYSNFYACILSCNGWGTSNYSAPITWEDGTRHISHCTIIGSSSVALYAAQSGNVDNSVFIFNHGYSGNYRSSLSAVSGKTITATGCVFDSVGDVDTTHFSKTTVTGLADPYVLASPFEGDFRPVSGAACDGAGDPALASPDWVPEEFRGKDVYGNALVHDNACNVGAVAGSVEMKGGFELFYTGVDNVEAPRIAGVRQNERRRDIYMQYYVGAVEWPRQVYASVTPPDGSTFLRFDVSGPSAGLFSQDSYIPARYPDYAANGAHFWLPPVGSVVTNYTRLAATVRYVSPTGSNANDGKSTKTPFGTLQYAVDQSPERSIVYALPGVYKDDGVVYHGVSNRVHISKSLVLKALDPTQETVIEGTDSDSGELFRCVSIDDVQAAVQGFTLRNGRVSTASSSIEGITFGGGFYGDASRSELLDCVIENCTARNGAAMYGGWAQRCTIRNNATSNQGIARACKNSACIFYGNTFTGTGYTVTEGYSFDCSAYEGKAGKKLVVSSTANVYNSIFLSGAGWSSSADWEKAGGFSDYNAGTGWTKADKTFVDAANGDYRLRSDSPAAGGGVVAPVSKNTMNFVFYSVGGFSGEPTLLVNGKPTAGAMQKTVPIVTVTSRLDGDVSPTGTWALEPGDKLTLTAGGDEARNLLGFSVNGVLAPTKDRTFEYVSPSTNPTSVVMIEAVYATNWYVNADASIGNDNNNGWTPETPKLTLNGAMAHVVLGDVVHAAAGIYNSGYATDDTVTRSRVSVPSGVMLLGENRATTIIKGEDAGTQASGALEGMGAGATRCVYLAANATVQGFTLIDGRTDNEGYVTSSVGGGVYGKDWTTSIVRDCIVTNCFAAVGGSGHRVRFESCRLIGNQVTRNGSAGRECSFYNTYIGGNKGGTNSSIFYPYDIVNCTYAADNSSNISVPYNSSVPGRLVNTLILGDKKHGLQHAATNVVYVGGSVTATVQENVLAKTLDEIRVDAEGRPLSGSCLIDAGTAEALADVPSVDADGVQRVYNGAVDIGACEFDWRPVYAKTLGGGASRRVVFASPDVLNGNGEVIVKGNLEVALSWASGGKVRYSVPLLVTGEGTLEVLLNGEILGRYTKADGAMTVMFKSDLSDATLSFAYAAADDEVEGAAIGKIRRDGGLTFIVH